MYVQDLPSNCKAAYVYDFGYCADNESEPSFEKMDADLKEIIENYRYCYVLIASINGDQKPHVGPVLTKNGFRCVTIAQKSDSLTTIYVYVKNISRQKQQED